MDNKPLYPVQESLDAHLQAFLYRKVEMVWGHGATPPVTSEWKHETGPRLVAEGRRIAVRMGEQLFLKSCYEDADPHGYWTIDRCMTLMRQLSRRPKFTFVDPDADIEARLIEEEFVFSTRGIGDSEFRV